jgi:arylsulfatase A-like enzyme
MKQFIFVLTLLLAPLVHSAELSVRPNIVFILADDLGWNDLGPDHGCALANPARWRCSAE